PLAHGARRYHCDLERRGDRATRRHRTADRATADPQPARSLLRDRTADQLPAVQRRAERDCDRTDSTRAIRARRSVALLERRQRDLQGGAMKRWMALLA